MAASWDPKLHPRAGRGHGRHSGRFVKKLLGARVGESLKNEHGVKVTSGVQRQGRRRRRLFSVEGGGVHRSAADAAAEAQEIGAPVVVGDFTGPKTHTGWLGRYRRMSIDQLEDEKRFLDNHGSDSSMVDPLTLRVRYNALNSALAEARGQKTKQERPGARKDGAPKPDGKKPDGMSDELAAKVAKAQKLTKSLRPANAQAQISAARLRILDLQDEYNARRREGLTFNSPELQPVREEWHSLDEKIRRLEGNDPAQVQALGEAIHEVAQQVARERYRSNNDRNWKIEGLREEMRALSSNGFREEGAAARYETLKAEVERIRSDGPKRRSVKQIEDELGTARAKRQAAKNHLTDLHYGRSGMGPDWSNNLRNELRDSEMAKVRKEQEKWEKAANKLHRELALAESLRVHQVSADRDARPGHQDLKVALAHVRPGFGEGKLKIGAASTAKRVTDLFDIAAQHLPKEWVDAINEKQTVEFHKRSAPSRKGLRLAVTSRARAHYKGHEHKIQMATDSQSFSVALHELGHAVENTNKTILNSEAAYYKERTTGSGRKYNSRKLKDIAPGSNYDSWEVAVEDEFANAYMGKDYGGQYYELLTMGLEGTFFNTYGMYNRDPGMRNWTLGILAGA